MASSVMDVWWSHRESATVLKNAIFRLAAETRSIPSGIAAISGNSPRLLEEVEGEISEASRLSDMVLA